MAEPTRSEILAEKKELEKELEELKSENESIKADLEKSPHSNDANYEREIDRLQKKSEKAESELKALREKTEQEQRERETIADDIRREEERRLAQFGISVTQNEHTRFRISPKPPRGQRDIFGDPESEVVNLGVELQDYNGGLYVPVSVIIEIGQSIGMLTKEQAFDLNEELNKTNAKVEATGALSQELISGITARVDHFYSSLDSVISRDSNAVSGEPESAETTATKHTDSRTDSTDGKDSGTDSHANAPKPDGSLFGL